MAASNAVGGDTPDQPARAVLDSLSLPEAAELANMLSAHRGYRPVYSIDDKGVVSVKDGNGFRLPTVREVQGLYGPKPFDWCREVAGMIDSTNHSCERGKPLTEPPTAKSSIQRRSLFDLLGNAGEWATLGEVEPGDRLELHPESHLDPRHAVRQAMPTDTVLTPGWSEARHRKSFLIFAKSTGLRLVRSVED